MNQFSMTTWVNPTPHLAKFQIHHGPGQEPSTIEIKPGEEQPVPSVYDNAIRTVRDGIVVGGLAPLLTIKGQKGIPLHDAIRKAASAGDLERKVLEKTGVTAGSAGLDAVGQLAAQNEELKARLAELEAKVAPKEQAPKEQPPKPPRAPATPTTPAAPPAQS